jgi:hypothetical protein
MCSARNWPSETSDLIEHEEHSTITGATGTPRITERRDLTGS